MLVVEWRRVDGILSLVEAVLIGWAGGGDVMCVCVGIPINV